MFDGAESVTTTEYEYDEQGRVTRAVATRAGEWTEVDRAEIFALEEYRNGLLCPCGCGFLAADTLSMEGVGPDFSASRVVCRARLAQAEAASAVDDPKKPPPVSARARVWTTVMKKR